MKELLFITISTISLIFIGCADDRMSDTESILLALLEADEISGVDGFDTGSDLDLNHEFGLETGGMGRTFADTLTFGE
ncbi:MAG: hypothetical protein ACKVH5_08620, partial [Fidelibacterota bacterium]